MSPHNYLEKHYAACQTSFLTPPTGNKYESIKRRVISAYDEGNEARLRRLLRGHARRQTNDLPPPFASSHRKSVWRRRHTTLFLEQLPEPIRAILAISDTNDLQRLAEMAKRLM